MSGAEIPALISAGAAVAGTGAQLMKSDPKQPGQMPMQGLQVPRSQVPAQTPNLQAAPFPQYSQQQMPDLLALLNQMSGGR